jgi:hypothetical protein
MLGLASSVLSRRTAAKKEPRGVAVKEEECRMPCALGRDMRVMVPEHEGQVGVGEGTPAEEEFGDLCLGHVTILAGFLDLARQHIFSLFGNPPSPSVAVAVLTRGWHWDGG